MRRGLLLALPLLLVAVAFWLFASTDDGVDGDAAARAASGADRPGNSIAAPGDVSTSQPGDGVIRTASSADAASSAAIPPDATWIEVRITDQATAAPVADADVWWMGDDTQQRAQTILDPGGEDRDWIANSSEDVARRFGWQTRSDRMGIARLHLSGWTKVFAQHDGRYGTGSFQRNIPPPPGGYRIELSPDLELRVRVVDTTDAPVARVPIHVLHHDAAGQLLGIRNGVTRSEADGMARLRHLQTWSNRVWAGQATIAEWRVRAHLVGSTDPGIRFDPKAPPAEVIVLRLPACGSVRARTEYRGRPLDAVSGMPSLISLFCGPMDDWQTQERGWSRPVAADGWAHFPWVPLGTTLTAIGSIGNNRVHSQTAGPTSPGQEVTIVLTPEDDHMVITGRVVDDQRRPLSGRQCMFDLRRKDGHSDDWGNSDLRRTDANGRFQLFAGRPRGKDRLERITVVLREPDVEPLRGEGEPRDLAAGEQDLGDIVLTREPLVVSCQLTSRGQPYATHVSMGVQRLTIGRDGREKWEYETSLLSSFEGNGRHSWRGKTGPGRHRLAFVGGGHLPIAPIEFTPGGAHLEIEVDVGSGLTASLLMPAEAQEQLRLVLRPGPDVAMPEADQGKRDRFEAAVWGLDGRRHQAQWRGLPSGTYTLELLLSAEPEPLLAIAGVQAPPPANGDARLADIDLRERIAILKLSLTDATGTPLQEASGMAFAIGQDPTKEWPAFHARDSIVRVATRPQPIDLLVAARGFRPQELRAVRADTEVRLHPWPELELVFADLPALPEGVRLFASLGATAPDRGTGNRADYLRPQANRTEVIDGKVKIAMGDGTHRLVVSLRRGKDQRRIDGVTPAEVVYGGSGSVTVRVPAQSLQKALAEPGK